MTAILGASVRNNQASSGIDGRSGSSVDAGVAAVACSSASASSPAG
jgi:hypothetical protein